MASLSTLPANQHLGTDIQVEYNFVEPLNNRYQCSICTNLLKEPHLTECCGHHFCGPCLQKWKDSANKSNCPLCRTKTFAHILDKPLQRDINDLKVYCSVPSKKIGCVWEGTLVQLEAHLCTCSFVEVKCENCSALVPRQGYSAHTKVCRKRKVKCKYCGEEGPFCNVVSLAHFSTCPEYPTSCPNFCGTESIRRSQVMFHKRVCPSEGVDCPFKEAGCHNPIKRKDLDSHLASSNQAHLFGIMEAFKKQQKEQSDQIEKLTMFKQTMEATISNVSSRVNQILETSSLAIGSRCQLSSIREDLSVYPLLWLSSHNRSIRLVIDSTLPWTSRPFFITEGYKFVLTISTTEKGDPFTLNLESGEHDHQIDWPPKIDFSSIAISVRDININLGSVMCAKMPTSKLTPSGRMLSVCRGDLRTRMGSRVSVFKEGTIVELRFDDTGLTSIEHSMQQFTFRPTNTASSSSSRARLRKRRQL